MAGVGRLGNERSEQRAVERHAAVIRCWVADGIVQRFARLVDLSTQGARVLSAMPPAVGAHVAVRFSLGRGIPPVEADAVVAWRSEGFRGRGGVMGIQFVHVSDPQAITAYLNRA